MKLVLQIALGVFLGALTAQLTTDEWRSYRAERAQEAEHRKLAAQERVQRERHAKARELLMRQIQGKIQEDQRRQAEPEDSGEQKRGGVRSLPAPDP